MLKGAVEILLATILMLGNTSVIGELELLKTEEQKITNVEENQKESEESKIVHVTIENFEEEVLNSSKLVLLDFYATWCGPCQRLSPVLEEISNEENKVKIIKINEAENEELMEKYNVNMFPTIIIVKDGEEQERIVGYVEKETLKQKVKENI